MPIYEYRCEACGHQEEFLQKVSEPPLTECPACHKNTFNKLLSAAGFQLKGSGWYATDFRNKSQPEKKPAAAGEKSAEKGGEAKSDAKPEPKPKSEAPTP